MRVVTSDMMREIDRRAISEHGIPGIILMERAGCGIAMRAMAFIEEFEDIENTIVLTGPGNNGGDGWVCARIMHTEGYEVEVYSVIGPDELKGDAKKAFENARDAGVNYRVFLDGEIELSGGELVIDALLGTGAKGEPRGAIARMIELAMESDAEVLAVDNPTGVDADSGEVAEKAILATETLSLGLPKLGQFQFPGSLFVGELSVVDIGIPAEAYADLTPDWRVDSTGELQSLLPFRPGDGHKGTFGKCSIIAGSVGMTGAVAMSAESCLRSGVGLVEMIVPEGIVDVVDGLVREAVSRPVQQVKSNRCLSVRALGEILRLIEDSDSAAFGPGIGTHRETVDLVGRLLPKIHCPMVIDADGLNCIAKLRKRGADVVFGAHVILTPHPAELSRLLDIEVGEVISNRFSKINEWARELGADVLVIKGAPTIIAGTETPIYVNRTGNNGMATGGSGDVLTGVIAGMLAQGISPMDSARLGVYIHGFAGDLASAELGVRGMIAGDIIDCIPEALLDLELYDDFT